jgi:hypothetical protein
MAKEAPVLFVTEHEKRIEHTFQRDGSQLLKTARSKDAKGKEKINIYVAGSGEAQQRPSRGGKIPYMNSGRTKVQLELEAYFAGDPVDWEDLESMEIDDVQAMADTAAMALGRKVDDVIISELTSRAANSVGDYSEAMSPKLAMTATKTALSLHWPKVKGKWFGLLDSESWNHMMEYKVFASSEYVGDALPFINTAYVRDWNGVVWMHQEGLNIPDTDEVDCLLYYGPALAAAGAPTSPDISWLGGQDQMWSVMASISPAKPTTRPPNGACAGGLALPAFRFFSRQSPSGFDANKGVEAMAFNADGLQVMGDNATIGTGLGSIRRVWFYVTNDTRAQVETDGYFDDKSADMQTGDIILVSYDNDGTEGHKSYTVTKTSGDIALSSGHGVAALTEDSGAIGGTNDGDLPALTGSPLGTDAAIITALIAAVRENAAKVNALIAAT